MNPILILTDYRHAFCSNITTMSCNVTMNVDAMVGYLREYGYNPQVQQFASLDLNADFRGVPILYTSSEDNGLEYKSYIEDLVLTLEIMGANMLPAYKFLRAHHNKSMMEALRFQLFPTDAEHLNTRIFGTLEELAEANLNNKWPKVIKASFGGGSASVAQAKTLSELLSIARGYSKTVVGFGEFSRELGKRLLKKGWQRRSLHRKKFIVQNMIPSLSGDFKVLCFGDRFYTLYRKNRPRDFRASGSGLFSEQIPEGVNEAELLDYASKIYFKLGTPVASLDIAFDSTSFHLIEFQSLHFGTLAAEKSTHFHKIVNGRWAQIEEECNIEKVYCDAIVHYLNHK